MSLAISPDKAAIDSFCMRNHIVKLAFFGSVLRNDFRPDSDVDVLVEFAPGHTPTLFEIIGMEEELSGILGRKADVRTPHELSELFRDDVMNSAVIEYAA